MIKDPRDYIFEKLQNIQDIPTLPEIISKVDQTIRNPKSSADDVAQILKEDPALAAQILKVANTVFYQPNMPVTDIQLAVSRIGMKKTRDIIYSLKLVDAFPQKHSLVNYRKFWFHSLTTAFGTVVLHRIAKLKTKTEKHFLSGLLHDIGILVLDLYFRDLYAPVVKQAQENDVLLYEVEYEMLGTDHGEIGQFLLNRWGLEDDFCDAVKAHHNPDIIQNKNAKTIAQLINIASFTCNNQGYENGLSLMSDKFSDSCWFDLNLSIDSIPHIIELFNKEAENSKIMLLLKD